MPKKTSRVPRRKRFTRPPKRPRRVAQTIHLDSVNPSTSAYEAVKCINGGAPPSDGGSTLIPTVIENHTQNDQGEIQLCDKSSEPRVVTTNKKTELSSALIGGEFLFVRDSLRSDASPTLTPFLTTSTPQKQAPVVVNGEDSLRSPLPIQTDGMQSPISEEGSNIPRAVDMSTFQVTDMVWISGLIPTKMQSAEEVDLEEEFVIQSIEEGPNALPALPCKHQRKPLQESLSCNALFLEELKCHIEPLLPTSWMCLKKGAGLSFVKMASNAGSCSIIQREAFVSRDGVVELFVHNKALPTSHDVWGKLPSKIGLDLNSICDVCDYALAVVACFRAYDICSGAPLSKFASIAGRMKSAQFDSNIFHESRYSTTHRSIDCSYLVILRSATSACSACMTLRKNIRERLSRLPTGGIAVSPKINTGQFFLKPPQG